MGEAIRTELTEEEKLEYAIERIPAMERGEGALFCPWCAKLNKPDLTVCCAAMQGARSELGRARLKSVETQLRGVKAGRARAIKCPYCDAWMPRLEADAHPSEWPRPMFSPFCCNTFSDAATALVERVTLNRLKEDKARIEDQVAAGKS